MNSYQEKNDPVEQSEFLENLAVLREISFFSEFPLEILKVFAYLCTREYFKHGDSIFSQNDDDGRAYCIVSGEALLSIMHEGKEVVVSTPGQNTFFGALTLAGSFSRLYSLTALQDTCCVVLTRDNFQEVIDQFPESRKYVIAGLTQSIVSWEKRFLKENIHCESCRMALGASLL